MATSELDRLSPALRALVELAHESPARLEAAILRLTAAERLVLKYDWANFWARPEQVWRPGAESITVYMCGRGWGKTRTGAEAVRWSAENPDTCGGEIAIAGRTAGQRDRDMLYGTSGIMSISPPHDQPKHRKSDLELVWRLRHGETAGRYYSGNRTRCRARLMSGDVPASFRGPGFGLLWADELPHWAKAAESWGMATFTMREGEDPRVIITTTPIPTPVLIEILFELGEDGQPRPDPTSPLGYVIREGVRVVTGSTYANRAHLAKAYLTKWIAPHEGTRLGSQEIHGQLLLDVPTALWRYGWIRRRETFELGELVETVVAVDPAGSHRPSAAETGLVAAGRDRHSQLFFLADSSDHYSPNGWAREAIRLFDVWQASRIVGERNYGGDMVESNVLTLCELPRVQQEREQLVLRL
ncbi:MAG: DNA-packaging protein, partial [Myxococcales bacterium]|nr:DNA-packaging protein [Myxococcales bacterium]